MAHGGQEAGLGAAGFLGIVARFGQRVFQRLAVGDVAADALHFHQPAMGIAHREIFPGDPAIALRGLHMLVIAGAVAARFQEAAEQGRAAFRMRLGREGIADGARRIEAEQLEEGVVAIGEAAGAVAAEDGVALRVHQALVARLALVQPRIDGGGILQRGFQASGDGLELRRPGATGLRRARARVSRLLSRKASATASRAPKLKGEIRVSWPDQHDIGQRRHQHGARHAAENDANDPRQHLRMRPFAGFPGRQCGPAYPSETLKVPAVLLTRPAAAVKTWELDKSMLKQWLERRSSAAVTKALQDCDVRGVGGV